MIDLLKAYSVTEIIIFIALLAIALKGFIDFIDWAKGKIRSRFNEEADSAEIITKIQEKNEEQDEKINQILEFQTSIQDNMSKILNQVQSLVESDRDSIKSTITRRHHQFCYEAKWIDDYNLDCLEKLYSHYKDEGGNSFIDSMMAEIRNLPRQPQTNNITQG